MKSVIAVVDGLNLFHALRAQCQSDTELDIAATVRRLLNRRTEALTEVRYFSAPVTHLSQKARTSQSRYLENLANSGVLITLGNFKRKQAHCPLCGANHWKYEEKETDVNLALAIVSIATAKLANILLIFSADTDLVPAIKMAQKISPDMEIRVVSTPQSLRSVHGSLVALVDGKFELGEDLVAAHQFRNA
jgi:uncharacterized LabA/DUF88 family protein